MRKIKKLLKRYRIKHCDHPTPWIVIARANDIWWRAPISLEFYKGIQPPKNDTILNVWCKARILKCKKCGGTLNEIKLGKKWLECKENGTLSKLANPIKILSKNCGTIPYFQFLD